MIKQQSFLGGPHIWRKEPFVGPTHGRLPPDDLCPDPCRGVRRAAPELWSLQVLPFRGLCLGNHLDDHHCVDRWGWLEETCLTAQCLSQVTFKMEVASSSGNMLRKYWILKFPILTLVIVVGRSQTSQATSASSMS